MHEAKNIEKIVSQEENETKVDYILIDDEAYNKEFWNFVAKKKKKRLQCFTSLKAFNIAKQNFSLDTPIYIDLNLKNETGLEVAKKLFEQGFNRLYITSGFINFNIEDYPYLSGVISKAPPF